VREAGDGGWGPGDGVRLPEENPASMTRRSALKAGAALVGGMVFTSSGILAACARERAEETTGVLTAGDQALAEEIADTILPTTAASPGAKAAGAGPAMNLLLTDCYDEEAQQRVVGGLAALRTTCRDRCGGGFASMPRPEREALLREIDAESRRAGEEHWYRLVSELAHRAYFSSEVGMTQALRWVETPGRWEGCVPLRPGQPAWA
jgi:hypothetical protein